MESRKAARTFVIAFALIAGAQPALAQSGTGEVVFGPKQYVRTTGAPIRYTDTFNVPQAVVAPFVLRIANGDASGRNRLSSATVVLNGVQVAGPADLNQKVALIERPVELGPANTLEVRTASGPGGFLTIMVLGVPLPTVVSLVPVTAAVTLGASTSLTLTLSAAQASDTVVPLAASPAGIVSVPASVTVPAGQTTAPVPVGTLALGQAGVTAALNGTSASSLVNVVPPAPQVTALEPPTHSMTVGATSAFTVRINAAQFANTEIALAVDNPVVLQIPASVIVAQGETSATFSATGLAIGNAVITAAVDNTQASAAVHVSPQPAAIVSLLPSPLPLQQGSIGSLTVTINVAQEADTVITIANSAPSVVQVPSSVTVAAGATSVAFAVNALISGLADITASVNGTSATSQIEVTPPPPVVTAIEPVALTLPKGTPGVLRAVVSRAPNVATAVALSSSNPSAAQVPATVNIPAGALFADFPVAAVGEGQATITASLNGGSASALVTVSVPELVSLALSPAPAAANVGEFVQFTATGTMTDGTTQDFTARVTWSSSNTAVATINATGLASASGPGESTITASFTYTTAQSGQPVTITASTLLTVQQQFAITAIAPTSSPVGTLVTLMGVGFDPVPANNLIVFRGVNNTTVPSAALTATTTQITVRVPATADTGPITLTNSRGTVQSPVFTVTREQDFQLVVSPASLTVYQGASNSAQVQLSSTGTLPFTGLVALSAQGLPSGVTASFSPAANVSATQPATVTFGASGAASPGTYSVTIRGEFVESGQTQARLAAINLSIQMSAGVTGVKGRFITPERVGIAGVIVRADITQNPQPQTTTDAAGNFQLVGLPAGPITLRFDATPANPLYPIWPYTTTLPANQITVIPDWTINPPPADDKFTPIANAAQEQVITDPRFPGLEIRLPAGASILGWDGVPKTRIAVEKVDLTKLPVTPPPTPTGSAYQMYFGTPMGGIPSTPIPVTLPNDVQAEPGESVPVYFFDGSPMGGTGEWRIAGQGIVSADGKSVRMPNGTGIPRFCGVCGLMCLGKQTPAPDIAPANRSCDGNPVDLFNGQEMPTSGGLRCGGLTPISTGRTYNPVDAFNNIGGTVGSIGYGWVLDYDIAFLPFIGPQKRIVLPGNNRVNFTDDGTGNYRPFDDPRFDGAMIRATNLAANEWELTFRDGRIWRFRPFAGIPTFIRGGPPTFVTEMVDPQGNVLPINRQSNGRITSVGTGARGVTMTYGSNGFVSEIRDTAGRTMNLNYTLTDRLASVTDPDGRVTSYTYVGDGEFPIPAVCAPQPSFGERLKTIAYPGRPTPTENFYGPGRRVLRQTGYDGREFRFNYKVTGACVTHATDPNTRCTGAQCPDVDSWDNFQSGWRIHGGTVVATTVVQPNGQSRAAEFNARGVTTSRTDAQGQRTTTKVDAANRVTERTDALNRTWKYQYDASGNVTQETDPLNRVTTYTYDARWNKPTSITRFDEANQPQTWQFTYDANKGTLLTATNPLNQTTNFAYTTRGELQQVTDPRTHATQFEYNTVGDLVKITDALGNITRFGTDGAGRRTTTTDPLGFITGTQYNGIDRVTRVTDARSKQTALDYDPAGRLQSVTNARNFIIESYGYDAGDRLTSRADAKNKNTTYTYDAAGRLSTMTDRRGQVTSYSYDEQDRVISISRPEGTTRFAYDAVGRLAEISDAAGSIGYSYDTVDRLVREVQVVGGVRTEIVYGYDALDRRTSRTVNGVANETTTYGYDRANRLSSIAYRGQTTTFEYDAAGRLIRKVLPNGIVQTPAYDDTDRLLSLAYTRPDNNVVESIAYTYDANGRRVTETKSAGFVPDTAFTASYDEADRMTSITLTATGQTFALAYDDNGNLLQKTEQGGSGAITSYAWDSRNHLTGITGPGITASFEYDALNRRIARTVNGAITRYVYDGLQAIAEIQGGDTNTLLTGLGLDEVIARYTSAGARTYLTDALNTVIAQSKEDQTIQNFYAYSPYGEVSPLGSDEGNSIQYTARENDQTGLYYYRARYYDPVFKRFVSEDPIGQRGGINLYVYGHGDPIQLSDPTGLDVTIMYFPSFPGHIGIGVNTYDTIGHYPQSRSGAVFGNALAMCHRSTPGIVTRDRLRQSDEEYRKASIFVITTTRAEDAQIQRFIDSTAGKNIPWNVCRDQCTRYVIDALAAGGVTVPDYGTVQPRSLFNELQQRYGYRNWP